MALENAAGTDYVASSSGGGAWGSGNETPAEDIINVRAILRNNNFNFTDLLIVPDKYKYLLIPNTYGITPLEEIEGLGIKVTETANIATGSDAIACDRRWASLIVAEDMTTEEEYVLSNQAFNNQVYERVVPVVYNDDAFVKMDLTTT